MPLIKPTNGRVVGLGGQQELNLIHRFIKIKFLKRLDSGVSGDLG
jgi:hypothetical protein